MPSNSHALTPPGSCKHPGQAFGPNNPPRLRNPGESIENYRVAMGWAKPAPRDVAGILHLLTPQQMAEEIVRLDAVLAGQPDIEIGRLPLRVPAAMHVAGVESPRAPSPQVVAEMVEVLTALAKFDGRNMTVHMKKWAQEVLNKANASGVPEVAKGLKR